MQKSTTPSEKMSHLYPSYGCRRSNSGAMYPSVPMEDDGSLDWLGGTSQAKPKSERTTSKESERRMFSGLISRCTMEEEWRKASVCTS